MLTPAATDPNLKDEKKRREQDPKAFGAQHERDIADKLKSVKAEKKD